MLKFETFGSVRVILWKISDLWIKKEWHSKKKCFVVSDSVPHTQGHTHMHTQLINHVRKTKSELMFI